MLNYPLFWGMLWALLLLGLFFILPPVWAKHHCSLTRSKMLILVVAVAIGVRMIPNLLLPMGAGYDIDSYQIVGNLVLDKTNIYTSQEAIKVIPTFLYKCIGWLSVYG